MKLTDGSSRTYTDTQTSAILLWYNYLWNFFQNSLWGIVGGIFWKKKSKWTVSWNTHLHYKASMYSCTKWLCFHYNEQSWFVHINNQQDRYKLGMWWFKRGNYSEMNSHEKLLSSLLQRVWIVIASFPSTMYVLCKERTYWKSSK